MTERVRIEHNFDCSEKAFWDVFLNKEYNHEMFCGKMKFPRWELTRFEETGDEVMRTVEVDPYIPDLPGPIKKVIGENIRYREEGRLDRSKNKYTLKIVPSILVGKILVSGEQFTEPLAEHRCKRVFLAEVEVKLFAVGTMIERQITSDLTRSYDIGARFTQNYMTVHGIS
jgi:hypothetical protein